MFTDEIKCVKVKILREVVGRNFTLKALVTGATGFIGAPLVRHLVAQNLSVRVLCRPTSQKKVISGLPIHFFTGDIQDPNCLREAASGCDCVFHLASHTKNWARDSKTFYDINVQGTENILEASRQARVKRVVLTSSSVTFGPSHGDPVDENHHRTEDFFTDYERCKSLAEQVIYRFISNDFSVVTVNPTRVFGPGLLTEANAVTKMIQLYIQGKWRTVLGDGRSIGNYVYVKDVVQGLWLAFLKGKPGEKYILGGENLSYLEFFRTLADVCGKSRLMLHIPPWMALTVSHIESAKAKWLGLYPLITPPWVRTFLADWAFSSEKAQKELGYRITPFRTALKKTVEWLTQPSKLSGEETHESIVKHSESHPAL